MVGRRDGLRSTQAASGRNPTLHRSLSRWRPIATRRHPRPCPHSLTRTSCCTRQAPLTTSAEDIDRTSPSRSGRPRPFRPSAARFYTQATRHSREEPLPHDTAVALIKSWRGRFGDTREFASYNRAGVLPTHRGAKVLIVTATRKYPSRPLGSQPQCDHERPSIRCRRFCRTRWSLRPSQLSCRALGSVPRRVSGQNRAARESSEACIVATWTPPCSQCSNC